MSIAITSIGVKVSYAFEASKGAGKPTTGYIKLPEIKEIPEMNPTPETIENYVEQAKEDYEEKPKKKKTSKKKKEA